jgi:RNA polymerase sigma-70 factor (ECF subfamily)
MSARAGHPRDSAELVAAYAQRVFGLHMRLIGRRDVAEDLTQETLLRALGGLKTYRPEGKFQAWIFRIAINLARDWIRRRGRDRATAFDADGEPPPAKAILAEGRPEADALRRERADQVGQALGRLADEDREVLLLRYYGELAFKDIARATGEPLGTVLARAHRAIRKLGELLPADEP